MLVDHVIFADVTWSGAGIGTEAVSTTEQRLRAVLAVEAGGRVGEVAFAFGVSRQSVPAWLGRYRESGLEALADQSHRPDTCPHQASPVVEAAVCEMRRDHPR